MQKAVVARKPTKRPAAWWLPSPPVVWISEALSLFISPARRPRGRHRDMLISTELSEIMSLSDRIAVMYEGKIVAIVPAGAPVKRS